MNEKYHYEYFAFISYALEDEKFAKWLRDNMESFRLPARVQKSNQTLLDRICNYFLDKKEHNTGKIAELVQTELFVSKYLLVICTPAAVLSKKVNEEIHVFIANGRMDDIVLLMLSGEPDASDPQNECLPVEVRNLAKNERPVIFDFQTDNHKRSLLNLIAYLMHVPVTSLSHNNNNKRDIVRRAILYLFVSILILALGFLWEYNRVRYEYYISYVDRWGIPEGIDPITQEQASAINLYYRFEYKHTPISEGNPMEWRLECVSCMDGYGKLQMPIITDYLPVERACSVARMEYFHGQIFSISYYNSENKLVSTCNIQDYEGQPQGWIERRFHYGANGNMMEDGKTNVSGLIQIPCIKFERDSDGYIQRISYHINNDRDIRRSGISTKFQNYGCDIYHDEKHRLSKIVLLSKDMKPIENTRNNIMSIEYTYDEDFGCVSGFFYRDKSGNFVDGLAYLNYRFDKHGNTIEISYYDKNGQPCLLYNSGVSVIQYVRDEHGAIKESDFLDQYANSMNSKQGYARVCYEYDSHGNVLSKYFYDEKGNLTLSDVGYAVEKNIYNEDDKIIESSYFGVDENPILNKDGYACKKLTYDEQNRVSSESFFNENGMPIEPDKVFGSRIEYGYCEDGLLISESYFDANGQPYVGQHGSKVVYEYDDRGNKIEKAFYDDHGVLYVGVDKVARFQYWYDDQGRQTEARCYDAEGNLTMHRQNFSIFRSEYDSLNQVISFAFFDKENKPCTNVRKYALIKQSYGNDANRESVTIRYDWDGNAYVELNRIRSIRDVNDQVICSQFFDAQGNRTVNKDGLSSWTVQYDQRGNRIACYYYGIDGEPSNIKGYNFASWKASYDYKDRRIEQSYYDIHGNLTANNRGVARWRAVYKDNGNIPYMYYYDLAGNLISNEDD